MNDVGIPESPTWPHAPSGPKAPLAIESAFCLEHGFELIEYGDGCAKISCEVLSRHLNRHGNAHGGLIAALLDTSMGLATRTSGNIENVGTASLNVNYLRPAHGRVVARARMRRLGRSLAFCDAEAIDARDQVVATATGVFAIVHLTR